MPAVKQEPEDEDERTRVVGVTELLYELEELARHARAEAHTTAAADAGAASEVRPRGFGKEGCQPLQLLATSAGGLGKARAQRCRRVCELWPARVPIQLRQGSQGARQQWAMCVLHLPA